MLDRIWVVGGTSGIGAAIAYIIRGDHRPRGLEMTGKEVDVRDMGHVLSFVERNGPFDGIVYSAGVNRLSWSHHLVGSDMNDLYDINVTGLVRVMRACPTAKRVVVIGSDAAHRPMRTSLAYCASKAALEMAVKVLAREMGAISNFAINIVAPGMTDGTEMTAYIDQTVPRIRNWEPEFAREYEISQIPAGRRATPEEIAEVAVKVLYMDTPYLNGATIEVNGGR